MPAPAPDHPAGSGRSSVVAGALLGAGVGVLGTAVHLGLAAPAGWPTIPWGVVLALVLVGSTQRWWMRRAAARGGRPVAAGAAVALGAFTVAVALYRLLGTDQLGLPWSPELAGYAPVALAASVAWIAGLPVLGVVLLALAARRPLPGPARASSSAGSGGRTSTLEPAPNPVSLREVDGQS